MSGLVQCNTCFAAVFRSTLFKLGNCPICKQITSLQGQIIYLGSVICALQAEIRCPVQPFYSIEPPLYQPPLPQRSCRRRAVWTTVGSGRVRAVNHKHKAFAVSLHNSYSALADLNRDIKETGKGICEDNSNKQGIVVRDEELDFDREKCESGITHQSCKNRKASKKRSHLLVGDSIIRDVNLGKDTEALKEVRCLPGATASRDKKRISKIIKNGSKDCDVEAIVHLGTNDLSQKDVLSVQNDFQSLGKELSRIDCRLTFSEVLPVYKEQNGKGQRIAQFNMWLKEWCKGEGFGYISHDVCSWSNEKMYKRDGLHPSKKGTELLGYKFTDFLEEYLN